MTTTDSASVAQADSDPRGTLWGHPRGLFVLFSTELWERFSFYAMRNVMTLYMIHVVLAHMTATQGEEASGGFADEVYGAYLGFVYSATFVGGMLADRLLGQRRAIYIGGVMMSLAHFMLTTHAVLTATVFKPGDWNTLFYGGLGLLCCGNGFFKPNISTIVGTLYAPEDQRRDRAFTIFYMGINIGSTLSSVASGAAEKWAWFIAYLLAGIGMIASLIILSRGRRWIGDRGLPPAGATLMGRGKLGVPNIVPLALGVLLFIPVAAFVMSRPAWAQDIASIIAGPVLAYLLWEAARATGGDRGTGVAAVITGVAAVCAFVIGKYGAHIGFRENLWYLPGVVAACGVAYMVRLAARHVDGSRIVVIIALCAFSMVFWGFFELQGSTILRFADLKVDLKFFNSAFIGNFVNPFLIILLGIPVAGIWVWLDKKNLEPSTPLKFVLGLLQVAAAFLVLWLAAGQADRGGKGSLYLLLLSYLLLTTGELCLSPVGLSMVTKLSPARLVGVFMGLWFLAPAIGNVLTGGYVGRWAREFGFTTTFLWITEIVAGSAVLLLVLAYPLKKMMHGVK